MLGGVQRTDYFAEAIRVGRIVRGLSVRQLSEATGIPTWLLQGYESGKSQVRPDTFVAIWRYLATEDRPGAAPPKNNPA